LLRFFAAPAKPKTLLRRYSQRVRSVRPWPDRAGGRTV